MRKRRFLVIFAVLILGATAWFYSAYVVDWMEPYPRQAGDEEKPAKLSGTNESNDDKTVDPVASRVKSATALQAETFFVKWLKKHGEKNVIVDADGVGLANNATRLKASLYGSKKRSANFYIAETEFRIRLPSGSEITEFLAGIGETEEQAINDTLRNFTLTTFHVVYKSFMNFADPHVTVKQVTINDRKRQIIEGDIHYRGDTDDGKFDLNAMRPKIRAAILNLQLSRRTHWIKIVYTQIDSESGMVSATLNNQGHGELTAAIRALNWPKRKEFYIAKQFLVIK